ncbi:hypothetical protein ACGFNX_14190 [Streptomyces sp. NPDC048723]
MAGGPSTAALDQERSVRLLRVIDEADDGSGQPGEFSEFERIFL